MKYNLKTCLIAACALVTLLSFHRADDDIIQKVIARLTKWTDDYPQEKVYLQTDKPFYAAGEDIWLKAYVTLGPKHQLSALSNIVNIELIDEHSTIKQAIKLPVINGTAWGDFALPDTLSAGNYRIRAYTNYMRNAGDDYFFDKTIAIGNSIINNVFARVNYQLATIGVNPQINAAVTYTDLNGNPYANKAVTYEVRMDTKNITRGHGITNADGVLNISFANTAPNLLKAGQLITNLKYADNKSSLQTFPIKTASAKIDVQFFAEGGNLVNNIRGKVAFKATGTDGIGVAVSGVVKDNDGNEIAQFNTPHLGMGYFLLMPQSGKTYTAQVTNPDGTVTTLPLPEATDKGYALMVNNADPEQVTVRVSVSADLTGDTPDQEISLVAQQNGVVCYAAKSKLTTPTFVANIPKSRFRTGIVQFTLFSANGEPLNERIAFIQNPDLLNLSVNTDKQTYAPRGKVRLDVSVKKGEGKPVAGNFSAVVIDESRVPADEPAETTILSSLLLTADLKGYIEKPNYYFTDVNSQTRANLDVLMLTQGYRRFVWKDALNNVFPPQTFQPEKSITVAGTIKTLWGKPVPKGKVMLIANQHGILMDTVADEQGKFVFSNLVFADSLKFVIQAHTAKDRDNVEISIDKITTPPVSKNRNAPDLKVSVTNVMTGYLQNSKTQFKELLKYGMGNNHVTVLKEVVIKGVKKPLLNSQNLNGQGQADQIIRAEDLEHATSVQNAFEKLLFGIRFGQNNKGIFLSRSPNVPMLLNVDGTNVDYDYLFESMSVADIASVEVLKSVGLTAVYGGRGAGGVLVITTKQGGGVKKLSPGILTYSPRGYYKAREFYSPRYDDPKTKAQMMDLRTTIFWKPNVNTDKNGNASFDFFNADTKGTYRVIVEGIDTDGNLGRQVVKYIVRD